MQFPVTIAFNSLGLGVDIEVFDAAGARIGFAPWRTGPKLAIYRDESLRVPIYTLRQGRWSTS